jgi:hypothetical protein
LKEVLHDARKIYEFEICGLRAEADRVSFYLNAGGRVSTARYYAVVETPHAGFAPAEFLPIAGRLGNSRSPSNNSPFQFFSSLHLYEKYVIMIA